MSARPPEQDAPNLLEIIEGRAATAFLAVLIIVSVLPVPAAQALWPLYVAAFGASLGIQLMHRERLAERGPSAKLMLALDLVAFLSFFPVERWIGGGHVIFVLLRLSRLLVLVRFAKELARDVYSIVTRREQLEQFGFITALVMFLAFLVAVVLSELEIPHAYVEGASDAGFTDRFWWAFRQLESPDNLVSSLRVSPLVAISSLALTITGVFIVSFVIGLGTNIVGQVVRAERRRPLHMRGHSIVAGPIAENAALVREFVRIYVKNGRYRRFGRAELYEWLVRRGPGPHQLSFPQMALVDADEEGPSFLYAPGMRGLAYRQGEASLPETLALVAASDAKRLLLASDARHGRDADALTIARLGAFRAVNKTAHAFVELGESRNVPTALAVGGDGTFALDMPRFLGLFLCHHLVAPGIEHVYQDLLTAEGSEIYTHVFANERDPALAAALAERTPILSAAELIARAYAKHNIVVIGTFLSDGAITRARHDLIPIHQVSEWLNPLDQAEPALPWATGSEAGRVKARELRGLVAIGNHYGPVRAAARDMLEGAGAQDSPRRAPPAQLEALRRRLRFEAAPLRRVAVAGYSPAAASLVHGIPSFVHGAHVVSVIGARADASRSLAERVETLGLGQLPKDGGPLRATLPEGGTCTVYGYEGDDLSARLVECLRAEEPVDSVVFLADPDSPDPDARTLLRVLRFTEALARGEVRTANKLHILVEFTDEARGAALRERVRGSRCGFGADDALRLTLVSTDLLRSYFMVHSAFVPGVARTYDELLDIGGQEIARLELAPAAEPSGPLDRTVEGTSERVGFGDVLEVLAPSRAIPIAIHHRERGVLLNPPPTERFEAKDLVAVFVIARGENLRAEFARANR